MPTLISGAVAADATIANTLQPPTKGVSTPVGPVIPSDWLARCMAGQVVPGCMGHYLIGSTMIVSPTVLARVKDDALCASLGLNAAQVSAFRGRIAAGSYVATSTGSAGPELAPHGQKRKAGVVSITKLQNDGTIGSSPWTTQQEIVALEGSGCAYYQNFTIRPGVPPLANGGKFIPMLVEVSDARPDYIAEAVTNAQDNKIFTFGESDTPAHGWTVQQCIDGWQAIVTHPDVIAHPEIKIGSLYTAADPWPAGSFFRQWMTGIAGMRQPDALVVDLYSGSTTALVTRINNLHAVYPSIPEFWIPEFACDGGNGANPLPIETEKPYLLTIAQNLDAMNGQSGGANVTVYCKWLLGPRDFAPWHWGPRSMCNNDGSFTEMVEWYRNCGVCYPV